LLPPVDFELAASPGVLVVSPRSRIARERTETLRPDLTLADIEEIERSAESDGEHSALVVPTGGVATYPAIVDIEAGYRGAVATAAHEWVHHYLALYPLGRSYFAGPDTRVINETVADMAGDEIARVVVERFGVPQPQSSAVAGTPRPNGVDPIRVLRDLRLEVDALLAAGRVEDAEQRMEEVRGELANSNSYIRPRRINQAYFAWYGTYAGRPESVDPLGPQLRKIRERAGSLHAFIAQVRDAQTRADIARLAGESDS
jgi:hypothetical protein